MITTLVNATVHSENYRLHYSTYKPECLAGLSEFEDAFAAVLESLECPDLAALVRGGKKYQRISFVTGTNFSDLPESLSCISSASSGSKSTFEDWKKKTLGKKYKKYSFLMWLLTCTNASSLGRLG